MTWRKNCGRDRGPLAPLSVPDGALHHVGSYKRADGRVLKVMRMFHPEDGPLVYEQRMDQPLPYQEVYKVEPMKAQSGGIFFLEYKYGVSET